MSTTNPVRTHDSRLLPIPGPGHDVGLLIARLLLGSIMLAHGLQALTQWKLSGTAAMFGKLGIPMPTVSAAFNIGCELVGGTLLILGLATQLGGSLIVIIMFGAWLFAHRGHGVFVDKDGWELVAALGLGAFLLTLVGPGRFSLDALLTRHRRAGAGAHRQRATV